MSTIQYMLLSLVLLIAAVEAKKILRAQEGAATTGRFIVKLSMDTSSERFNDLATQIEREADDRKVHGRVDGKFAKVITAKLSEEALEMASHVLNFTVCNHLHSTDQRCRQCGVHRRRNICNYFCSLALGQD